MPELEICFWNFFQNLKTCVYRKDLLLQKRQGIGKTLRRNDVEYCRLMKEMFPLPFTWWVNRMKCINTKLELHGTGEQRRKLKSYIPWGFYPSHLQIIPPFYYPPLLLKNLPSLHPLREEKNIEHSWDYCNTIIIYEKRPVSLTDFFHFDGFKN